MVYEALGSKKEPFRLLITGSRHWSDIEHIWWALNKINAKLGSRPGILVHGGAKGADLQAAGYWDYLNNTAPRLGERLTEAHPVSEIDYERWGKGAPIRRNIAMVRKGANLCLAFHADASRGTQRTIHEARRQGIKVIVFQHKDPGF